MTPPAPVIHICGFPGSGKFTIGRHLAARLGGKLLHNHLALDPASALFDRSDARHTAMRQDIRAFINKAAKSLPDPVPIIVTDALEDTPRDQDLFAPTVELAQARHAPLKAVTLAISREENRRRLRSQERERGQKLTEVGVLDRLRDGCKLLRPEGAIEIDVTDLTPADAASEIIARLGLAEEVDRA